MQSTMQKEKNRQKSTKQPKGKYLKIELSRFDEMQLELDRIKDNILQAKEDTKVEMRQEIVDICFEMVTEFIEKHKQEVSKMLDTVKTSIPFFGKRILIVVKDKQDGKKA